VTTVSLRSDTARYQEELLLYCGEGKDPRFGVIDFASALTACGSIGPLHGPIGADVTEAFRAAVRATAESEWKPLIRMFDGQAARDGPGVGGGLLRTQLGRAQSQAGGLP
jgi:hypothetical protein